MVKISVSEIFNKKGNVELYGWVHDLRDLSKIRFIVLKDITGRVQCVAIKGETTEKVFDSISNLSRESVIRVN